MNINLDPLTTLPVEDTTKFESSAHPGVEEVSHPSGEDIPSEEQRKASSQDNSSPQKKEKKVYRYRPKSYLVHLSHLSSVLSHLKEFSAVANYIPRIWSEMSGEPLTSSIFLRKEKEGYFEILKFIGIIPAQLIDRIVEETTNSLKSLNKSKIAILDLTNANLIERSGEILLSQLKSFSPLDTLRIVLGKNGMFNDTILLYSTVEEAKRGFFIGEKDKTEALYYGLVEMENLPSILSSLKKDGFKKISQINTFYRPEAEKKIEEAFQQFNAKNEEKADNSVESEIEIEKEQNNDSLDSDDDTVEFDS